MSSSERDVIGTLVRHDGYERVVVVSYLSWCRTYRGVAPIVVSHPRHGPRQLRLVAAFRGEVEVVVRAD